MATTYAYTSWRNPTGVSQSRFNDYGMAEFTNINGVKAIDGNGAYLPGGEGINNRRKTYFLMTYGYGFNIPSKAQIVGVEVQITKRKTTNGGTARDELVALRYGSSSALNNIGTNHGKSTLWGKSFFTENYGSGSDRWGANLTPGIVNSSSFGVNFRAIGTISTYANISIDNIRIRIKYAITSATVTPPVIEDPDSGTYTPGSNPTQIAGEPFDPLVVGENLLPYEWSKPVFVEDMFVRDLVANTDDDTKVSISGDYIRIAGYNNSNATRLYLCLPTILLSSHKRRQMVYPVDGSQEYTFQVTAKAPSGKGCQMGLSWFSDSGYISENNANFTGTGADQLVYVTATAPSNATRVVFFTGTQSGVGLATGEYIDIKKMQFNKGAFKIYRDSRIHITSWNLGSGAGTVDAGIDWANQTKSYYPSTSTNMGSTDSTYAIINAGASVGTDHLHVTGYGFSVDTDMVVCGVAVAHRKSASVASSVKDRTIYLRHTNWTGGAITYGKGEDRHVETYYPLNSAHTTFIYGGLTDMWGISTSDLMDVINTGGFGYALRSHNTNASSGSNAYIDNSRMRIIYYEPINREIVPCIPNDMLYEELDTSISQTPIRYIPDIHSMKFARVINQIRRETGYIGVVKTDRGHHYDNVTRSNKLLKENARGAVNYSKSGEIEETRDLTINLPQKVIKSLEGMIDLQGIVPINTVLNMDDNHPYAHKGYGILHNLNHERINNQRSLCKMDIDYVTKDLLTPLTVDYLIKTVPPLGIDIITNTLNSIFYLENSTISNIPEHMVSYITGTPVISWNDLDATIALKNSESVMYVSNESVTSSSTFSSRFLYTKPTEGNVGVQLRLSDMNTLSTYLIVEISGNTMFIGTYNVNNPITRSVIIGSGTEFNIEINVDINNVATVTLELDNNGETTTYIENGIDLETPKNYKGILNLVNYNSPTTSTITLKQIGLTKKLFTDNIDTTLRNVIHIPEPLNSNIQPDFIRKCAEGNLYCYINPYRDIIFKINPGNYFDNTVRLLDENGNRILTTDLVINNQSTITIENELIKIIFNINNGTITVYGFLFNWIHLVTLTYPEMFHVKPISISFDHIVIKVGETTWTLRRGKPFVEIEHPYNDIGIQTPFTHYWHDNGNGICVEKEAETTSEPIVMNTLFYCSLYNPGANIGLQIFRPQLENITLDNIPRSDETGIGWFNPIATENERHYEIAMEYITKSVQDTQIYF